jgi:hypothetical protein
MSFIGVLENVLGKKAQINMLAMQPGDVPATAADILAIQAVEWDSSQILEFKMGLQNLQNGI